MSLDKRSPAETVTRAMATLPVGGTLWVALSGGHDSVALLHLARHCHQHLDPATRPWLQAVHVNHELQPAAASFVTFCRSLCQRWAVPLTVVPVEVADTGSLEAAARDARYAAFAELLEADDVLWLAHHGNDQAETLLLRLMRGAGLAGLSGMPATRPLGAGRLERPLLMLSRDSLVCWTETHGLDWIDDPSNDDECFDRNYLRRTVMPALAARWPALGALSASRDRIAEAAELLDELAALDLARLGDEPGRLPLAMLNALSRARRRLLVRSCLERLGLPTPPRARLETLLGQCAEARRDAEVYIAWDGGEARVWRARLYLRAPLAELPADWQQRWSGQAGVATPVGRLPWQLMRVCGAPVDVTLRFRCGGERLRQRGMTRRLKQLLQTADMPPWQRGRLLVAWQGSAVVAVFGEGLALVADGWQLSPE